MGLFGIPTTTISGSAVRRRPVGEHQFLSAARQFAVDEHRGDDRRHQTPWSRTPRPRAAARSPAMKSNPSADNLGNPNGEDNYTLARNLGVVTRMQNLASATQSLMSTASSTEGSNTSQYQMAIYTFANAGLNTIQSLTSNMATAQTAAGNINVLQVYETTGSPTPTTTATPTPTSKPRCRESTASCRVRAWARRTRRRRRCCSSSRTASMTKFHQAVRSRSTAAIAASRRSTPAWCTTVKNRGIQIAVLYTAYLPLPTNSWYNSWIAPFQNQISPNMENCASTGMFFYGDHRRRYHRRDAGAVRAGHCDRAPDAVSGRVGTTSAH